MARELYILRVRSGRELHIHDMLTADPVLRAEGVDCYTPFETKHQRLTAKKRALRERPRQYAEPVMGGWFFIWLPTPRALARCIQIIETKPYLHGLLTRMDAGGRSIPLTVPLTTLERMGRSYDPKRDSRKNLQRIYGQSTADLPALSEGDVVRILDGAWSGLDFVVQAVGEDFAKLSAVIFGSERVMDVARVNIEAKGAA